MVRTQFWTNIKDPDTDRWIVPIKISSGFPDAYKMIINKALRQLESEICIDFREEENPSGNYINVINEGQR